MDIQILMCYYLLMCINVTGIVGNWTLSKRMHRKTFLHYWIVLCFYFGRIFFRFGGSFRFARQAGDRAMYALRNAQSRRILCIIFCKKPRCPRISRNNHDYHGQGKYAQEYMYEIMTQTLIYLTNTARLQGAFNLQNEPVSHVWLTTVVLNLWPYETLCSLQVCSMALTSYVVERTYNLHIVLCPWIWPIAYNYSSNFVVAKCRNI